MKKHTSCSFIRWGIIGCGDVTEAKSGPAYQQTQGFEVVAVMRRDAEKAKDYATRHGIPSFYSDANKLIHDPKVDAVYIATPPDSHMDYALRVCDAGKPCCIEKPLAPTYTQGKMVTDAFHSKGLPLFVAYYRRCLPRFEQVRSWIIDKAIGDIRHVHWTLHKPPTPLDKSGTYHWRTDVSIAPGGHFDDLASHGLDLITHFFGPIKHAQGSSTNQQGLYTAKDAVTGSWLHDSGITGSGSWNFGCSTATDLVEIYGSTGRITLSVGAEAPISLHNENGTQSLHIPHPKHVQQHHVKAMRDFFTAGTPHPSTGHSATHTSWVMDSILGKLNV